MVFRLRCFPFLPIRFLAVCNRSDELVESAMLTTCFRLFLELLSCIKITSAFTERSYRPYIYIDRTTVDSTSVGLAQARPNYITHIIYE